MAVARTPHRADAGGRCALGRAHRASGRCRSPFRCALDASRSAPRALPSRVVQRRISRRRRRSSRRRTRRSTRSAATSVRTVRSCWRPGVGDEEEAVALVEAGRDEVSRRGEGMWLIGSQWTLAELFNGLGRWEDALRAAEWVAEQPNELGSSTWISAELIEAAVRSRQGRTRGRCARPILGDGPRHRNRLGVGHRGEVPRPAEPRRGRRRCLSRGHRSSREDTSSRHARAHAPRVRRVASAGESPRRCARRAAAGTRHVRRRWDTSRTPSEHAGS